jgi:ABC-type multidrug transport system ATPase subunit
MKHLAVENNLNYGKDVKLVSIGSSLDYKNYLDNNKNRTLFGVLFWTDSWKTEFQVSNKTLAKYTQFDKLGFEIPCRIADDSNKEMYMYSLMYNFTLIPYDFEHMLDWYRWNSLTRIKTSIDNGILRELQLKKTGSYENAPKIENSESKYPLVPDRAHEGFDASAVFGSLYFFVPSLTIFSHVFGLMMKEKELHLRVGLHVFGLSSASHWTAWIITSAAYSLIPAVIFPIVGEFLGMGAFINSPYWLIFTLFFVCSFSMWWVGFALVTFCTDQKSGNVFSYVLILLSIIILIILHNPLTIYFMFFNQASASWIKYTTAIFHLLPGFNFALLYGQVARITWNHFDGETMMQIPARFIQWNDLFVRPTGRFHTGDPYEVPCIAELFSRMMVNILVYWVITWYFDHVMPNNRGRTHPYLFFLSWSYWFGRKHSVVEFAPNSRSRSNSSVDRYEQNMQKEGSYKDSILEEKYQILEDERQNVQWDGLRIIGLTKSYRKYPFGCKSSSDVRALKGVYLEAKDGELLSILGHNGAGKTTLINILTGQLNPSGGDARICDYRLSKDMNGIRKILGVVPQFDILWDKMTPKEHLKMFWQLKNIRPRLMDAIIKSTLIEVGLWNMADNEVRTLSGGMKRRLSVAISGIGNPRIIIMDEPTTGLDPVSRRKVWELIQKLKKDRVVILTTHSMEEADVLSDKIAIIASGKFKCVGTQLSLKHQFGDGYRITVICDIENSFIVKNTILKYIPEWKLIEENAGSLFFTIPVDKIADSKAFFTLLNQDKIQKSAENEDCPEVVPIPNMCIDGIQDIKGMVKDCGISHTTLEEVFLKVTKTDKAASAFIGK